MLCILVKSCRTLDLLESSVWRCKFNQSIGARSLEFDLCRFVGAKKDAIFTLCVPDSCLKQPPKLRDYLDSYWSCIVCGCMNITQSPLKLIDGSTNTDSSSSNQDLCANASSSPAQSTLNLLSSFFRSSEQLLQLQTPSDKCLLLGSRGSLLLERKICVIHIL